MYSADSGGLQTDVYLVGLHRDVRIEQYLALEIQLERRLGSCNSCSLSKDRYVAYRGTTLPSSPFDCRSIYDISSVGFGLK